MVTGLRATVDAAPRGECELHRTCATGATIDGDSGIWLRSNLDDIRVVFTRARDMVEMPDKRIKGGGWKNRGMTVLGMTMRKQNQPPWRGAGRVGFVKLYRKLRSRACTAEPWCPQTTEGPGSVGPVSRLRRLFVHSTAT